MPTTIDKAKNAIRQQEPQQEIQLRTKEMYYQHCIGIEINLQQQNQSGGLKTVLVRDLVWILL